MLFLLRVEVIVISASLQRLGLRLGRALRPLRSVQFVHRLRRASTDVFVSRTRNRFRRTHGSRPRCAKLNRLIAALRQILRQGYIPDWRPAYEIPEDFYALAA